MACTVLLTSRHDERLPSQSVGVTSPGTERPLAEQELKAKSETVLYQEARPPSGGGTWVPSLGPQPYPAKSYPSHLDRQEQQKNYSRPR